MFVDKCSAPVKLFLYTYDEWALRNEPLLSSEQSEVSLVEVQLVALQGSFKQGRMWIVLIRFGVKQLFAKHGVLVLAGEQGCKGDRQQIERDCERSKGGCKPGFR